MATQLILSRWEKYNLSPEEKLARLSVPNTVSGCLEWRGCKDKQGYGLIKKNRKRLSTHRLAWKFANKREIPVGMCICHHCDNRSCISPDHLYLGTAKSNAMDRVMRGRSVGRAKGNLTADQVREIKAMSPELSLREVAKIYKTFHTTVLGIRRGKLYTWVD